jgi:hypothetical protein
VLTYYAYLAWLIFALLLCALIYHCPLAGAVWLAVVLLRVVQFLRLGARSPSTLCTRMGSDREAPLPPAIAETPACPAPLCDECGALRTPDRGSSRSTIALPAAARVGMGPGAATDACERCEACDGLGRVLLVGNGPSIRERGLGSVIDSFDTVVRFNSFVTKGLEEHAGSKTSLWCHMMQWYHISTVEIAQKAAWLPTCYAWNHVVLAPLVFVPTYLMPMMPPASAITWSLPTYWRAHRALGLRLHQVPTTGFVMLIRLLESVDRVHIVGFDGFSSGKELHYYKERRMQVC